MAVNKKTIQECRDLIIKVFDALDSTGTNSDFYKAKLAGMTDEQFLKFAKLAFPFRFHDKPFVVNPTIADINKACNILKVPLLEKIRIPDLYKDENGNGVESKECYVGYIMIKKVQQFISKKNAMSTEIATRDMKTGLLTGHDKNGKATDREMEALAIMGLDKCMEEFSRPRADAMETKNLMYNTISTTGTVRLADLPKDPGDSLARNMVDVYLTGSFVKTNMINSDYTLRYTAEGKKKGIGRV